MRITVDKPKDGECVNLMKQLIFAPNTVLEGDKDYTKTVNEQKQLIEDKMNNRKIYMRVDKELAPGFTYKDQADIFIQSLQKYGKKQFYR